MFLSNIVQPKPRLFPCNCAFVLWVIGASLFMSAMAASAEAAPADSPAAKPTNAPAQTPTIHFSVSQFEVEGNTLLPEESVNGILSQHTETNITFDDVASAV